MKNLNGRVAFVTGGSRGIGRALCLQLAERGVHVYTCARDEESLQETEQMARTSGSITADSITAGSITAGSVSGIVADVADLQAMKDVCQRIASERGELDILVNNAGVLGPRAHLEHVGLQAWRNTITVNVDGVFIASKLSINALRRAGGGIIINVSSSVGRKGRGGWGPYAVSKHAVEGLTGTLADELADDGIAVVSMNPGGTATDMRQKAYPDEDPETLPTPDEVARTFMLLIERVGVEQTGRQYNARDLMDLVGRDAGVGELPYVGEA